jgi:hypothetical protein
LKMPTTVLSEQVTTSPTRSLAPETFIELRSNTCDSGEGLGSAS